jgi:signal transduction histidine kinase
MTDTPRLRTGVRWSVRSRILASILVVAALGMTVAGGAAYLLQRERTLNEIDDRLVSRVETARQVVSGEATPTDIGGPVPSNPNLRMHVSTDAALASVLSHVPANRNESSLGIIDGRAKYIPGTARDFAIEDDPAFVSRIIAEVADGSVKMGTSLNDHGFYRYIAAPMSLEGEDGTQAEGAIYVAAVDVNAELASLGSWSLTYVIASLIALFAIGLVGWFFAGRLLRPIRQLRLAASRITATDLKERIPVVGSDDVSELTATVNDMLGRLDGSMTSQNQLIDDVRHELKTPITIVRGHLEVMDVHNLAEVEATRALAIDELDRMAGLVDDIESLAETQLALTCTRTDAATFTADVFAKASVIGGHDWVLVEKATAVVAIDAGRVTQAWLQLADNAAKYSPANSTIEIGSTASKDSIEFWVADSGPGIAPAAVERIFERFGRVDTGRGIRGSGLGLAIVKAIAVAHGGTVNLTSSPQGSRFGIVVPTLETMNTEELEGITP